MQNESLATGTISKKHLSFNLPSIKAAYVPLYVCGEDLLYGMAIWIDADGLLWKADAINSRPCVAFAAENGLTGEGISITNTGTIDREALEYAPGDTVFLSGINTDGFNYKNTCSDTELVLVQFIGKMISASSFLIEIEEPFWVEI